MRIEVTITNKFKELAEIVKKASFKNLGHAAATLRKDAIASIKSGTSPSPPGTPPNTQTALLQRAILFAVAEDGETVLIGPSFDFVGEAGAAHEFGGRHKANLYPKRPFMKPAFERILPRFAGHWSGSIGE